MFSHLFHRLPPGRLAVLSSPVPVSLASICSGPFLGSSRILWLLPHLGEEPHLTNHSPSPSPQHPSLSIVQRLGFLYLRPLPWVPVPSLWSLSPPFWVTVLSPFSWGGSPYLILSLSLWVSDPFSLGLSLPSVSLTFLSQPPCGSVHTSGHLFPQPLCGLEVALQLSYPSPSSQPQSLIQNGRGRQARWGPSQVPHQGHLSLARTPPTPHPSPSPRLTA